MQSKRQLQVGEIIKRNFSEVLLQQGYNIYGSALVSVTNVVMSNDLSIAKIYLSLYNTEDKAATLGLIKEHTPKLRNELFQRLRKQMRKMPQIVFFEDETVDEMYKVDALFRRIEGKEEEE